VFLLVPRGELWILLQSISRTLVSTFLAIYYAVIIVKVNGIKFEPLKALLLEPKVNKISDTTI
jgi:hypothetical protein